MREDREDGVFVEQKVKNGEKVKGNEGCGMKRESE